ncbi:M23 family metallopeptidase [Stakelama sp. CBK3Z-3]|uniref:M23 family metallopeptidase n=1 Tax=Stakelama flava TaxID=2860338 RepID=A0ABS6XL54_9SPHN|nr:M23 family metallopeptidase [Stakelama flava]MBW4330649.1 M23 family metallopeptidase [Stakelama flava]
MFLRNDIAFDHGSGTGAVSFGRLPDVHVRPTIGDRLRERFPDFEIAPDLGSHIGSRHWWRGAATCAGLCALTVMLSPGISRPILAESAPPLTGAEWDAARSQSISSIALGASTGDHRGATDLVRPLADTPERPIIQATAVVGHGDDFATMLQRSGVGKQDALNAASLIDGALDNASVAPGTRVALTLGRRADKSQPRPLEKLAFRARFDLRVELDRAANGLVANRIPIAIDHTPLRITGTVGSSLYRSARAAGAPARAVEAYIKAIASRLSMSRVDADDRFDLVIERARAETGEVQLGDLLYAGLDHSAGDVDLLRWTDGGKPAWYDRKGVGETKGMMVMPVNGRITSTFGMRMHPLLHYKRMHKGLDIAAPYGTPLHAAAAGTVIFAGRAGGYGNMIKIRHSGGYVTLYGHMSKFAVRAGQHVDRGQRIGNIGSTGISTGPHVHYEVQKDGRAVNPRGVSYASTERLGGSELRQFKAKLSRLLSLPSASQVEQAAAKPQQIAATED